MLDVDALNVQVPAPATVVMHPYADQTHMPDRLVAAENVETIVAVVPEGTASI